jgi:hypothetical protein
MDQVTLRRGANIPRRQKGVDPTKDEASETNLVFAPQIDNHPGGLLESSQQRRPRFDNEFRAAVQAMLDRLGDSGTRVARKPPRPPDRITTG